MLNVFFFFKLQKTGEFDTPTLQPRVLIEPKTTPAWLLLIEIPLDSAIEVIFCIMVVCSFVLLVNIASSSAAAKTTLRTFFFLISTNHHEVSHFVATFFSSKLWYCHKRPSPLVTMYFLCFCSLTVFSETVLTWNHATSITRHVCARA